MWKSTCMKSGRARRVGRHRLNRTWMRRSRRTAEWSAEAGRGSRDAFKALQCERGHSSWELACCYTTRCTSKAKKTLPDESFAISPREISYFSENLS